VPWSFPLGEGFDGASDLLKGEVSSQPLVHSLRDLGRDALPADHLGFRRAWGQRVRGIQVGIEARDVQGEVALT